MTLLDSPIGASKLHPSRRDFLRSGALVGGGFVLAVYLPRVARGDGSTTAPNSAEQFAPNAFVRIDPDDTVTVIVNHSEMGQGPYTTVPMLVCEDLDADWDKVKFAAAPVDAVYNHTVYGMQMTGGSSSTWSEWERLRKAGAAARMMLIAAAAQRWNVAPDACRTDKGRVFHDGSNNSASYGQLVADASKLKPPAPSDVKLKDAKDFKLLGKPTHRLDTPDKCNGRAIFGLDVVVPDMLVAVVARSPVFRGKLKSFDAERARSMPGVRHVVQIPRGVAVVADGFWQAKKARDALQLEWDEGALSTLDSKAQGQEYAQLAQKPDAPVARKEGDVSAALANASRRLEAVFDLPYLAHATMEPLNCVADVRDDRCEVWTGTQFQTVDRDVMVQETGLKPEQVNLHTTLMGGGFGRRAVPDGHFVREAVQISKAIKRPVKVVWTREDDMHGGWYRPRAYHAITAALDSEGKPVAWKHRIVTQSIMAGTPFEKAIMKEGIDETCVEGAKEIPYAIPNILVDWQPAPTGVPVLWWRSVGHSHSAFAVESFMDELAHAAGKDPFEYRRDLLAKHPRRKRVLELVAEKSGWGKERAMPPGFGRGIAVHESFGSYVAHVAEVSVAKSGYVRVHKVWAAVDCGPAINPLNIQAQVEGGIAFGLTACFYGQITFEHGRVRENNFYDYRMLRINEMPEVEVHIVKTDEKMGGIGEPGVPPVAPAVANAVFAATGKRIRTLPMQPSFLAPT